MEKKESYRHILPHFQQPRQAYFVTWSLIDAIPRKTLKRYSIDLEILKSQINSFNSSKIDDIEFKKLKRDYSLLRDKYINAFHKLLDKQKNPTINLSKPKTTRQLRESLLYWEGNKLQNFAFVIMPNHIHWVFKLLEKDEKGNFIYLQDILQSVKRFTANEINKIESRKGSVWQKESFDTTIRDEKHLHHVIEYTLNNPVSAGLVDNWIEWEGCWCYDT